MAAPSQVDPSQATQSVSQASIENQPEDTYLLNPEPENEHVGVDDEGLYIKILCNLQSMPNTISEAEYVPDSADDDSDSDDSDSGQSEKDEIVKDIVPPHIPEVVYDKDDPPMTVGSIYHNIDAFKLALSSHAIKHEFEYNTEKSEPGRFRAYAAGQQMAVSGGLMLLQWMMR